MIRTAKQNEPLRIHYAKSYAEQMPFRERTGIVVTAARGRPRNALLNVNGVLVVVPFGNLERQT